jgi:hypothetical protein
MKFSRWALSAAAISALMVGGVARAELKTYIDQDEKVGDAALVPGSQSAVQRDLFLDAIVATSLKTETFESFTNGTKATNGLTVFGANSGITMTSIPGAVNNVTGDESTLTGRFNTTQGCTNPLGCNWWETDGGFTISFDRGYSAFAFYGTDFSDYGATVTLQLVNSITGEISSILVSQGGQVVNANNQTTTNDGGSGKGGSTSTDVNNTGSLLHFGFTDNSGTTYSSATILISQIQGSPNGTDFVGFDDFIVGDSKMGGNVPEPGSLALVGLSLLGLAAARRRKAAAQA